MNICKSSLAVLVATSISVFTVNAQITSDFFSAPGVTTSGIYSNSSPWPTNGGFQFQIGSFGAFTPTSSNTNDWLSNWTPIPGALNTPDWIDDGGDLYFIGSATYSDNLGAFAISNRIYVWGYNSQAYAPGSEWILFQNNTDPDWSFKDVGTGPLSFNLDASSDTGMITVLGSGGGGSVFQSAAVPEPSTWLLISGALTVVMVFRRRKANSV